MPSTMKRGRIDRQQQIEYGNLLFRQRLETRLLPRTLKKRQLKTVAGKKLLGDVDNALS